MNSVPRSKRCTICGRRGHTRARCELRVRFRLLGFLVRKLQGTWKSRWEKKS